MKWEKTAIKNVCTGIFDGPHATPPDSESGAIFLGISNITTDGHLDFSTTKRISEKDLGKWTKRVTPQFGDIVFSYEATLNLYAIIPKDFWGCLGRRMALIRPDEKQVDRRYLLYYFFSDEWRATIKENTVIGATVDRIPLIRFPDFDVSVPPLDTQRRIADILSAYDDLIENNQKQIKLLEEAAQRLYKEWFVDLRFPGHENVPVVDGVPKGWKSVLVEDMIGYEIGGGWGEDDLSQKCTCPAYVIRGTDFYGVTHGDFSEIPYRYHAESNLNSRVLLNGDILFEVSGGSKTEGVAKTVLMRGSILNTFSAPVMCASFCKLIRPKKMLYSQYLYDTFQFMRRSGITAEYDKRSASSIVNYRWKDFLSQQQLLLPSEEIIGLYNNTACAIYDCIVSKSILIKTTKAARDRLLPKLMSGELEV